MALHWSMYFSVHTSTPVFFCHHVGYWCSHCPIAVIFASWNVDFPFFLLAVSMLAHSSRTHCPSTDFNTPLYTIHHAILPGGEFCPYLHIWWASWVNSECNKSLCFPLSHYQHISADFHTSYFWLNRKTLYFIHNCVIGL